MIAYDVDCRRRDAAADGIGRAECSFPAMFTRPESHLLHSKLGGVLPSRVSDLLVGGPWKRRRSPRNDGG